jgi:hypothetical protein
MDLVTLVTACALAVDPRLMHALVWHQSGGEPWAVAVPGEPNPRVYSSLDKRSGRHAPAPLAALYVWVSPGFQYHHRKSQHPSFCHAATSRWQPFRSPSTPVAARRIRVSKPIRPSARLRFIAAHGSSRISNSRPTSRRRLPRVTRPISTCRRAPAPRFSTRWPIRPSTQILPPSTLPMPLLSARGAGQAHCFLQSPNLRHVNQTTHRAIIRPQSNHLHPACPRRLHRKAIRKTVSSSCVVQAKSVRNDADRKQSRDCEDRRTKECEPGGDWRINRRRAR